MKTSIVCGVVVALALTAACHIASAEVVGLKSDIECKKKVLALVDLTTALANLSPQTAADYFDSTKNQFVFCMETAGNIIPYVINPTTLTNNTSYPVIINNLNISSSKKGADGNYIVPTGTSLLTIGQGTGEIAFQNLKADNLRAPIAIQGKTTFLDSTVSCDAASVATAFSINSNSNTFRKVNINECMGGLGVTGSFNAFYEVAIKKTAADESQIGSLGVNLAGGSNTLFAATIQNYKVGVTSSGNGNRIFGLEAPEGTANALKAVDGRWYLPSVIAGYTNKVTIPATQPGEEEKVEFIPAKNSMGVYFTAAGSLNTSKVDGFERGVIVLANKVYIQRNFDLGGTLGAVVIGHDPISNLAYQPVTVSKNTFSTPKTIIYVDNGDKAAYRLLGVEWMGKVISKEEVSNASSIIGKLLDQSNNSTFVEMTLKGEQETSFKYAQNCDVKLADKRIEIVFDENGVKTSKNIEPGEKFFDCTFVDANKNPINLSLVSKARITSNSPTISLMTDDVEIAKLGDVPTVLVGATSSLPIGSGDLGGDQQSAPMGDAQMQTPDGGSFANMPSGGSVPPADVHDVGDNSGNSSNMLGGVAGLDGGVPTVATGGAESAGAQGLVGSLTSGGGCSLTGALEGQNNAASALIWLLALLPIPILLPMRNRKK